MKISKNGVGLPKKPKNMKTKLATKGKIKAKTTRVGKQKKQAPLKKMSPDDYLSGDLEEENSMDEDDFLNEKQNGSNNKSSIDNDNAFEMDSDEDDDEDIGEVDLAGHKKDLEKLKDTDPEFFKFLQENDQDLLNFDDVSDGDDDEEDAVHQPPDQLEAASDESDYEPEDKKKVVRAKGTITLKNVEEWRKQLQSDKSHKTLRDVLEAFQAALQCVVVEKEKVPCRYHVEGAAVFNAVLRLCVIEVQPALRAVLNLPATGKQPPTKSKNWSKVRVMLKDYLLNLTRLCQVTSAGMLSVLLKHVHQMIPYAVCFPNMSPRLLSRLVGLWTHEADVVRVLAFLCLLRIANVKRILLSHILKKMYLAFVRNTKFVSPSSIAGINFLRQSLAEMFALDPVQSYQHGFLYIRQLSIHLRNAVTLQKKESYQAVYNWQFIQSLQLWSDVVGLVPKDSPLTGLAYPLVQITLGTIKLVPSAQYYPLRFHCIKFLINLMEKQGVFIPVLPLLLEVLRDFDFNRKHSKVSMKPMELSCVLRCSKQQMQENGWKDAIIEWICALLLEAFTVEAHRLSFPDMVVPAVILLKRFLKTCKVGKYSRQVKAVLDKVQENAKMVETERNKATIHLNDPKGIAAIEAIIRSKGTPLAKYYEQWRKVHQQIQAKKFTDTEKISDIKLPTLYKFSKKESRELKEREEGPVELFPSDDSDNDMPAALIDNEEDEDSPKKSEKNKKKKQKEKKKSSNSVESSEKSIEIPADWPEIDSKDIVLDFNLSDME